MSLPTTPKRRKRELRNHPPPLDMTLLGVPGSSNPRRIAVSAARPSIKESVTALGLNYLLPSGGVPDLPAIQKVSHVSRPLPEFPDTSVSNSSLDFVLDISSSSSHYTTTDASAASSLSTTFPNLTRLQTIIRPESADATIGQPPPLDSSSPVTPPLLTPAPIRPTRRWGMTIFPQSKVIRRTSSAPSSPTPFENAPVSPTSIIAIKSPVEWGSSRRFSDAFSFVSSFTASSPKETNVPSVPSIPTHVPPIPLIRLPTPPTSSSLPPTPVFEDTVLDICSEASLSMSEMPGATIDKNTNLGTKKEPGLLVETEERLSMTPQVKTSPRSSFRRANSHYKRSSSTYRRESSVRRPLHRHTLKRDSGAPFATATVVSTESTPPPAQLELVDVKEGRRNTRRWSSRKFLQSSTKRAKATVVMMRRGKEKAEEKDIVAVIPQLRELKAPKRLRL